VKGLAYLQSLQYQTPLIRLPSLVALLQMAQTGTTGVNKIGFSALAKVANMA
jgi:hypothetical protein